MTEYTFNLDQLYGFEAGAFERRKLHNRLGQVRRASVILNAAFDVGLLSNISKYLTDNDVPGSAPTFNVDKYIIDRGVPESIEDANEIMKAYYKAVTPGKKK